MLIVFTLVLLVLVVLFFLSNPRNKINRWCFAAGMLFWLGIAKETVRYSILPSLQNALGVYHLQEGFAPVNAVCTWILYSFAMPTVLIFSLHFCNWDQTRPKHLRAAKFLLYIPALVASFFFPPLDFIHYQLSSLGFWITYSCHNIVHAIVYAVCMVKGVQMEKPGKLRTQKKRVRMIVLPPVLFWVASIFLTHPFQFSNYFNLWKANALILLICLVFFIVMAFKDGFMGLKLSGKTFTWNSSDMNIINTGAEYASHALKNQTAKMELCIEHLKTQYFSDGEEEMPEELAILSRSITTLKSYVEKIKRHSQNIRLAEAPCNLSELLTEAMPVFLNDPKSIVTVRIDVPDDMLWVCDRNHMSEVFANIMTNAAEAIRGNGGIEISGAFEKTHYLLHITDTGVGLDEDGLAKIFTPYFTTKSTEKNFGLGLPYCKNVLEKHGGLLSVASKPGKGTTVTIVFPSKKVTVNGR